MKIENFGAFAYPAQVELKKTKSDEPSESKQSPANDVEKPKPDKKPPVKPKSKSDEKLFQELVGQDPKAAPVDLTKNPLEEAVTGMRSAQERIAEKDTGQETREIQEQVVANLQKLIDMMKDRQSQPPSASSGSPQSPEDQQPRQPQKGNPNPQQRVGQQNQQTNPEGQEKTQQQLTKKENEDATESTDEQREGRKGNANLAPRPEMLNEVWGHLPPSVRLLLLNNSSDKYLPKYEDLARRYFEALAEPARNQTMKPPQ